MCTICGPHHVTIQYSGFCTMKCMHRVNRGLIICPVGVTQPMLEIITGHNTLALSHSDV